MVGCIAVLIQHTPCAVQDPVLQELLCLHACATSSCCGPRVDLGGRGGRERHVHGRAFQARQQPQWLAAWGTHCPIRAASHAASRYDPGHVNLQIKPWLESSACLASSHNVFGHPYPLTSSWLKRTASQVSSWSDLAPRQDLACMAQFSIQCPTMCPAVRDLRDWRHRFFRQQLSVCHLAALRSVTQWQVHVDDKPYVTFAIAAQVLYSTNPLQSSQMRSTLLLCLRCCDSCGCYLLPCSGQAIASRSL